MYVPHLNHLPADGHLGCFHVLTIINSAAMNTGANVSFQIRVFSDICPGVQLLDHMVTIFLNLENLFHIVFKCQAFKLSLFIIATSYFLP